MRTDPLHLLLVEDDPVERRLLRADLSRVERLRVECAASGEEALDRLTRNRCDAVMTDLMMPGMSGIDLIRRIRSSDAHLPIIVVTANAEVDRAVEGMRAGATEYLVKPIDADRVLDVLSRSRPSETKGAPGIVGSHPRLDEVRRFARRVAGVPHARVLLTGESGTGKSQLARAIHDLSGAPGDFVVVNCAALPGNLLESELFGHEKGAFTDARAMKRGLIEMAQDGTLFLDEIGAMPAELQAKLLLFLESHEVRRVGGTCTHAVRTRVVAATNEDLRQRVRDRTFRADLLYRLDVASLELPPLREMPGVTEELATHFVREVAEEFRCAEPPIGPDTFRAVATHPWPGNVRELRNVVERAVLFHDAGELVLRPPPAPAAPGGGGGFVAPWGLSLREMERRYLEGSIRAFPQADFSELAQMLAISRKTLWTKRKKYGL